MRQQVGGAMAEWHEPIIKGMFIFLVIYAIVTDVRELRVPNWVPIAIGSLFLVYSLTLPATGDLSFHLLTGIAVLIGAFALFAAGVFGGGDAKFLSVLALWMGPANLGPFILLTTLLGGATALGLLGLKKLMAVKPALEQRAGMAKPVAWARAGKMPYALPLGVAALMMGPALF